MEWDRGSRAGNRRAGGQEGVRLVAIGLRAARFGGSGSVSASAGVKLREAFANLARQIPAGRGRSIAADVATARSLF